MRLFKKQPDFIPGPGGLNLIEKLNLGDIEQSILIQAEDPENPVMLFLHGGPSLPLPGVSSRGRDYTIVTNTKELIKHFVLVFWDQRGTGKAYHPDIPAKNMGIAQFVDDTLELTDYLRERFNQQKIYLAAHSWGTILGMLAVDRSPEKYFSYTGLSQIVNWVENDRLGLIWAKEEAVKRNNKKALDELNSVGEPPFNDSFERWAVLRRWQQRFGTLIYSDHEIKHPGIKKMASDMILSPDYSLSDVYNSFVKGFKLIYTPSFIRDIAVIDFKVNIPAVNLPVTFIHGTRDVHVHGSQVKDYFEGLRAEQGKKLIWVEKSSHVFHPDDTLLIQQYFIDQLKQRT